MHKCLVVLLLSVLSPGIANAQRTVGDIGDPVTWEIRGVKTFKPDEIRQVLRLDFDTLVAAHPRAVLPALPKVLERRLTEGFRHAGFPQARVQASHNDLTDRIVIVVEEGTRCIANEIAVTGVSVDLARAVAEGLTKPHLDIDDATPEFGPHGRMLVWLGPDGESVDSEEALWRKGEPAAFEQASIDLLKKRVATIFDAAGYFHTRFTCDLVPHRTLADLVIDVKDVGIPAVVREIDVTGNQVSSDGEIAAYVNVKPGVLFSTERRRHILQNLWRSGRFAEQQVSVQPTADGVNLKIAVVETPNAPRLSEPLSREAAALLKCREWLVDGPGRDHD